MQIIDPCLFNKPQTLRQRPFNLRIVGLNPINYCSSARK